MIMCTSGVSSFRVTAELLLYNLTSYNCDTQAQQAKKTEKRKKSEKKVAVCCLWQNGKLNRYKLYTFFPFKFIFVIIAFGLETITCHEKLLKVERWWWLQSHSLLTFSSLLAIT